MTVLNEGRHAAEFILSEASGHRSRERGTLLEGESVIAGQVLGIVAGAADATVGTLVGGNANGTLTLANPKTSATVKEGVWKVVCIEPISDAGTFEVLDPDGVLDGVAQVAVAYTGNIKFTIADGANNFAAGDYFPVTVTRAGGGPYIAFDPDGDDGSQLPAAISLARYDATDAAIDIAVIARKAELNGHLLAWPAGITSDQKAAAVTALAARGIIIR